MLELSADFSELIARIDTPNLDTAFWGGVTDVYGSLEEDANNTLGRQELQPNGACHAGALVRHSSGNDSTVPQLQQPPGTSQGFDTLSKLQQHGSQQQQQQQGTDHNVARTSLPIPSPFAAYPVCSREQTVTLDRGVHADGLLGPAEHKPVWQTNSTPAWSSQLTSNSRTASVVREGFVQPTHAPKQFLWSAHSAQEFETRGRNPATGHVPHPAHPSGTAPCSTYAAHQQQQQLEQQQLMRAQVPGPHEPVHQGPLCHHYPPGPLHKAPQRMQGAATLPFHASPFTDVLKANTTMYEVQQLIRGESFKWADEFKRGDSFQQNSLRRNSFQRDAIAQDSPHVPIAFLQAAFQDNSSQLQGPSCQPAASQPLPRRLRSQPAASSSPDDPVRAALSASVGKNKHYKRKKPFAGRLALHLLSAGKGDKGPLHDPGAMGPDEAAFDPVLLSYMQAAALEGGAVSRGGRRRKEKHSRRMAMAAAAEGSDGAGPFALPDVQKHTQRQQQLLRQAAMFDPSAAPLVVKSGSSAAWQHGSAMGMHGPSAASNSESPQFEPANRQGSGGVRGEGHMCVTLPKQEGSAAAGVGVATAVDTDMGSATNLDRPFTIKPAPVYAADLQQQQQQPQGASYAGLGAGTGHAGSIPNRSERHEQLKQLVDKLLMRCCSGRQPY